jgi:hypothetical protein
MHTLQRDCKTISPKRGSTLMTEQALPQQKAEADELEEAFAVQLNGKKRPGSFSRQSIDALLMWRKDYTESLGLEAIRLARLDRADYVSEAHVDDADRIIRGGRDRTEWLKWTAALFLGVAIPLFIQYITSSAPQKSLGIWLSLSLLIGSIAFGGALISGKRGAR